MTFSGDTPEIINKKMLYGEFTEAMKANREWREKLAEKASHKALDIPMDSALGINTNTTNVSGIGWKEMAVVGGGLLGATGLGLGAYAALKPGPPPQPPAAVAPANPGPAQDRDTDTTGEYDIEWDKSK